ncbi:MAG TPA: transglycosylase domain-containing protein [Burkholderiaceae bacterium]|nr:transglycosylase domain-containing protein [Burkholderiaceae bacterium]
MHALPPDDDFPGDPPLRPPPPRMFGWRHPVLYTLLALAGLLVALAMYVMAVIPRAPGIEDLKQAQTARPSVLLSADGKTLTTFRRAQQESVPLRQISPYAVKALLATEDRRFYEHRGIDAWRTAGALWNTLTGDTQGGSTITQQLARNLFPEEIGRSRTLTRKLKEMVTALRIERIYPKDQILETYLNTAPFLYNVVGIEMAARTYFDKSAAELGPLESATLIGMLKGTAYYNPVLHPERALKRRNLVLQQMVRAGVLGSAQYEALHSMPLGVNFNRQQDDLGTAPHFAAYMRRWLIEWADEHDYNLYRDGLVIRTTIDSRLQQAATRAVQREAEALQHVADVEWSQAAMPGAFGSLEAYAGMRKRAEPFRYFFTSRPDLLSDFIRESQEYKAARQAGAADEDALRKLKSDAQFMARLRADKTRLQAGFCAIDPTTGEIKAWVGSRDYEDDKFDHVAQAARQPGSTFKPIVYGAALESGIGPDRTYLDAPVEIRVDARTVWRPTDMHGSTGRMMTLREGLVYSKNTITAQVSQDVGVPRIVTLAQSMGITQSRLAPVPSLALGTSPVTLLEMVDVYATIAAQGTRREPVFVRRISDRNGKVLAEFDGGSSRALSSDTAVDLIDMLRGVVNQGTGTAVKTRFGIVADIAGKTGTTQNNTDGWFIFMHPSLVAGAWVGFNDQRVTLRSDYWGQGGHSAVYLVGDFFREVLKSRLVDSKASFPPPRTPPPSPLPSTENWASSTPEEDRTIADEDAAGMPANASSSTPPTTAVGGDGSLMIGDAPGIEAMRRNRAPPKSAEELDGIIRTLGRNAASGESAASSGAHSDSAPAPAADAGTDAAGASSTTPPSAPRDTPPSLKSPLLESPGKSSVNKPAVTDEATGTGSTSAESSGNDTSQPSTVTGTRDDAASTSPGPAAATAPSQ